MNCDKKVVARLLIYSMEAAGLVWNEVYTNSYFVTLEKLFFLINKIKF